jgi:hypothetical protein
MDMTTRFSQVLRILECVECGRRLERRFPEALTYEQCVRREGWEIVSQWDGGQELRCDRCPSR